MSRLKESKKRNYDFRTEYDALGIDQESLNAGDVYAMVPLDAEFKDNLEDGIRVREYAPVRTKEELEKYLDALMKKLGPKEAFEKIKEAAGYSNVILNSLNYDARGVKLGIEGPGIESKSDMDKFKEVVGAKKPDGKTSTKRHHLDSISELKFTDWLKIAAEKDLPLKAKTLVLTLENKDKEEELENIKDAKEREHLEAEKNKENVLDRLQTKDEPEKEKVKDEIYKEEYEIRVPGCPVVFKGDAAVRDRLMNFVSNKEINDTLTRTTNVESVEVNKVVTKENTKDTTPAKEVISTTKQKTPAKAVPARGHKSEKRPEKVKSRDVRGGK